MTVKLIVRSDVGGGVEPFEQAFEFDQAIITIGRREECDLSLQDSAVSRSHAQIELLEDTWIVQDVGSSKGTYFNGEMLNPQEPVYINPGDVLTIAGYTVEFGFSEPEQPADLDEEYPQTVRVSPEEAESQDFDRTEVVQNAFLSKMLDLVGGNEDPPFLTVLSGNEQGKHFKLEEQGRELLLGRSRHCDLVITDECISREHAKIKVSLGQVDILDQGSRNGLLINGTQVQGSQRLRSGDEVRLGTTRLMFTDPAAALLGNAPQNDAMEEAEGTLVQAADTFLLEQAARDAEEAQEQQEQLEETYDDEAYEEEPLEDPEYSYEHEVVEEEPVDDAPELDFVPEPAKASAPYEAPFSDDLSQGQEEDPYAGEELEESLQADPYADEDLEASRQEDAYSEEQLEEAYDEEGYEEEVYEDEAYEEEYEDEEYDEAYEDELYDEEIDIKSPLPMILIVMGVVLSVFVGILLLLVYGGP